VNNLIKHSIEVELYSDKEGWLLRNLIDDNVTNLKSYAYGCGLEKGDYLKITRDLVTSPG